MKRFQIKPLDRGDRDWVLRLLEEWWGSAIVVTCGRIHEADELPGFIAMQQEQPVGLVTYHIDGKECEIVSINSLMEGIGIGTALIDAVKDVAIKVQCRRLWLITTNDNTRALRYYQKRDFRLVVVYRNAVKQSRRLKPEIPLVGNNGIPLRDEIELELLL